MTEEEKIIDSFVVPSKKKRYKGFVANARTRKKFLNEIRHSGAIDPRFEIEIPGRRQTAEGIVAMLKEFGAGDKCFASSDSEDIDAKWNDLEEAVGIVLGRTFGTLLCCTSNGTLAYFENEEGRYILRRNRPI